MLSVEEWREPGGRRSLAFEVGKGLELGQLESKGEGLGDRSM